MAKTTATCMTEGCNCKVKTRGVCTKCYSTLRVYVQKGKLTWDSAVAAGLCKATGSDGESLSPIQAALARAEEQGVVGQSMPTPQMDPDQEPPPQPELPPAPAGYYYDADRNLQPIPKVQMPAPIDPSPQGYAAYDPNAPAAQDAPHVPTPRDVPAPEPVDPMDDIEEEEYLDDESPEQKKRRLAIERRHKREQELRYIEENGIQPPKGGNVVVVPAPKVNVEKNGDLVTGYGAGPAPGSNIKPGIYLQQHDAPAQQTIDGEPLLPGWSLAPDGVNLISPQGKLVDTTPRAPGQPVPQAIVLPTTNAPPQTSQLIVGHRQPTEPLSPVGQGPVSAKPPQPPWETQ